MNLCVASGICMLEQDSLYLDNEPVSGGMDTPLCGRSYTFELNTQTEKNLHNRTDQYNIPTITTPIPPHSNNALFPGLRLQTC